MDQQKFWEAKPQDFPKSKLLKFLSWICNIYKIAEATFSVPPGYRHGLDAIWTVLQILFYDCTVAQVSYHELSPNTRDKYGIKDGAAESRKFTDIYIIMSNSLHSAASISMQLGTNIKWWSTSLIQTRFFIDNSLAKI